MAFEKILILESSWADQDEYILDSRSTRRIYESLETLMSLHEKPVFIIERPLLQSRFIQDISQFIELPANKKGPNIVILSGHGKHRLLRRKDGKKHRRLISAIDGTINVSTDIRSINDKLARTIFILDACSLGENIDSFRKVSKSLGVIGFVNEVNWVDSSMFILALLLKYQEGGVFQMQRVSLVKPENIINAMKAGPYQSMFKKLNIEFSFKQV